jgi:hypothetical protein
MTIAQPTKRGAMRARYPKRGSLREALHVFYRENPGAILGRQEALRRFGCSHNTLDRVMQELRDDGVLVAVFGYMLADASAPLPCRPALPAKPKRSKRTAPQPAPEQRPTSAQSARVAISVFQLAETL